uniref:VWFA domain-containing protein n=1 Tax=Rhabditophanes sp. KR3021 TaxID=114890 RepID=A0AC35UBW8_9BILA
MKAIFLTLLSLILIQSVNSTCAPGQFTPAFVSAGRSAFLSSPSDDIGNDCNPNGQATYSIYTAAPKDAVIISFKTVTNLKSSGGRIDLYDGITATGTPYFTLTDDVSGQNAPASISPNVTIVYSVPVAITDPNALPVFFITAESGTPSTTAAPMTTTTVLPTGDGSIIPDPFQSQNDVILILDLGSNIDQLSKVAVDIIKTYYINIANTSLSTRINMFFLTNTGTIQYSWEMEQSDLITFASRIPKALGKGQISIAKDVLGAQLISALGQTRSGVQKTLILITDNDNQAADAVGLYPITSAIIDDNDIHPVIVNISPTPALLTKFAGAYTGTFTNTIVQHSYNGTVDLFENVLFKAQVLCNLDDILAKKYVGKSAFVFPFSLPPTTPPTPPKSYCNYMQYNFACKVENAALPITVTLNSYNLEAGKDFIQVYDNESNNLMAEFTGTQVAASVETITSKAIKVVLVTDNNGISTGWLSIFI